MSLDVPASFRALFGVPDVVAQRLKFLVNCAGGIAFDFSIASDQGDPERSQNCAASVFAARLPRDCRLPADAIYFIDEIPRALVGHVHGTSGSRN